MAFQGDSIYWVEVEKVVPNPFQPRREFDQNKLQELADSIRMYGVLQPLTVTRREVQQENGTFYTEYELIAGERRLRASKLAGVAQVPVIIREGEQSEQEKLELAIIENLQREDLNAVDRAIAFKQLSEVFGLSHAHVAQKVGRSREYVSNSIRLLGLPEHILDSLKRGDLTEGHARTLLMLSDRPEEQEVIYKEILLKKLSVREVERIVRKIATDKVRKKNLNEFDANLIELEKQFTETLGTRVQIQKTDFGGKLTIDYFSEDDLEAILRKVRDEVPSLNTVPEQPEIISRLEEHIPLTAELNTSVKTTILSEPTKTTIVQSDYQTKNGFVVMNPPRLETEQISQLSNLSEVPQRFEEVQTISKSESLPYQEPVVLETKKPYFPILENHDDNSFVNKNENHQPEVVVEHKLPTEIPVSEAMPEPVQVQSPEEDDSSLYSIRNFTV